MRVMLTGDVVGKPGRKAFQKYTAQLKAEKKVGNADFYNIVDGEVEEKPSTDLWDELLTGEAM